MSKVDAMQAMREARYAATVARRSQAPARTVPAAPAPAVVVVAAGAAVSAVPGAATGAAVSAVPGTVAAPAAAGEPTQEKASEGQLFVAEPVEAGEESEPLCGHRSMNNRNCRRPAGHPEKNHRYN